ncbi:aminotransferase-like domain-containing protein [Alcaligenes ammonioxydans]|jgi:DNA-binding transcriptional MocR family regulator|uniref:PLP-dependent aminotransferase family protein n=1 Tax=Alcaligenes ammonioxydans TaxID=2582914 RepID=A0ABX8SU60_9BURK|nr:PLP-dependent aminotransferase family protein [Alcaligenes ammonioxydans]QBH18408.1 PLP-dependent aminotransferase family protein [Alcaligenes faecalis]QXX79561.1 PLP-dependent aminotransferase family protein [Alcaligenes ammonioxydans]WGQ34492.1 PLP-dependent aminotransferase family protein [Alcaligenes faecalis]
MDESLYLTLSNKLNQAISSGTFKAGSRLPSVRQTAKTYSVSANTVVAAYRHLEDQGLIQARPQSGFYVREQVPRLKQTFPIESASAPPTQGVLQLIETTFATQQNPAFTNISLACPKHDSEFYPSEKLSRIMSQIVRRQHNMICEYALPPGSLNLRHQIARRMLDVGAITDITEITITHGCIDALHLALLATTKSGDCVALESPTYFYLIPLLATLGLNVIEVPTDAETGLDLTALELLMKDHKIQAIVCMPNLHNPLGCSMPLKSKQQLAKLVNKYQVPLIEDGLYCELHFDQTLPAVKAFDSDGWIIFCSSFTKTLAPDFRIGWICAGRFNQEVQRLKNQLSMTESRLLCETIALFLESGGYDHHLRKLRKRYQQNMAQAQSLIANYFPAGTRTTKPQGGFVFWVEIPGNIDTVELHIEMLKENICLTPGALYSPNSRYNNALRISCCYPFNEKYRFAIERVGAKACALTGISSNRNHESIQHKP